ncbi:hypothetical protein BGX27_007857 [Mortierella sp. AM989]|nr:hypothetical protein BGX27_007857 [Mortierella sp. AM989]
MGFAVVADEDEDAVLSVVLGRLPRIGHASEAEEEEEVEDKYRPVEEDDENERRMGPLRIDKGCSGGAEASDSVKELVIGDLKRRYELEVLEGACLADEEEVEKPADVDDDDASEVHGMREPEAALLLDSILTRLFGCRDWSLS